jgi:trimethylamine--corrinoid protein Co-methyltransferase
MASIHSVIDLFNGSEDKEFIVGQDHLHFDPGSAAVTLLDHKKNEKRKAVIEDPMKYFRE